jgi:hypothetical protein
MAQSKIPTDLLISVATGPVLLALIGGRVLANVLQELGQASEEIFRGDRLPVLHIPVTTDDDMTDS